MGFLEEKERGGGGPIKDLRFTKWPYDKRVLHTFWQMAIPTQDQMIATPLAMTAVSTTIKERGGKEDGVKEVERGVERQGTMAGMRDR